MSNDKGNNNQDKEKPKINKHQFYFEMPLYETVELKNADKYLFSGTVDAYVNGIETTYEVESSDLGFYISKFRGYTSVVLTCKRKKNEPIEFFIYKTDKIAVKVGQYYSLADIQFSQISKKYDKILDKESLKLFKKAIGLASHGVGAGSFVYLRRIFEKLIKDSFKENRNRIDTKQENFYKLRMVEKVEVLKDFLPSQLVDMKSIYSVLSTGVHELSEQECLTYFPAIKLSIELILDQKIENEQKANKDRIVKQRLQEINTQIKKQ